MLVTSSARAEVDLELRPRTLTVASVGDMLEVDLVAVATGPDEPFAGLDAIIVWDPSVLRLSGDSEGNSPFSWTRAIFPNDSGLDGLNADCGADSFCSPFTFRPYNDGDAFFQAVALFLDQQPTATGDGLIVTTLSFEALTSAGFTSISLVPLRGLYSGSRVVATGSEGETTVVTGALRDHVLSIQHCGGPYDFDWDCFVDPADAGESMFCLTGPGAAADVDCTAADGDGDADVDLRDMKRLQISFAGQ